MEESCKSQISIWKQPEPAGNSDSEANEDYHRRCQDKIARSWYCTRFQHRAESTSASAAQSRCKANEGRATKRAGIDCSGQPALSLLDESWQTSALQEQRQTTATALRCLSVPKAGPENFLEYGIYVRIGPVSTAEEELVEMSYDEENVTAKIDTSRMRQVAHSKGVCFRYFMVEAKELRSSPVCHSMWGHNSCRKWMKLGLYARFVENKTKVVETVLKLIGCSSLLPTSTVTVLCLEESVKGCATEFTTRVAGELRFEGGIWIHVWGHCTNEQISSIHNRN